MNDQRQLEAWGGEVHVPRWLRRLARRPPPTDTPERAAEARREVLHPAQPTRSVHEQADIAIWGGFSEVHECNKPPKRGG
jgi:hypothetical protein